MYSDFAHLLLCFITYYHLLPLEDLRLQVYPVLWDTLIGMDRGQINIECRCALTILPFCLTLDLCYTLFIQYHELTPSMKFGDLVFEGCDGLFGN